MRVLIARAFAVLVCCLCVIAQACSFAPDFADGTIACGAGGTCPPGLACAVDGRCYHPGSGPGLIGVDGGVVLSVVSVTDVAVQEGTEGTTDATFTVRVIPPSDKSITVDWATVDDTAKAGSDYLAAGGTITIAPGSPSQTITVKVMGDRLVEGAERFLLELENPTNATLGEPARAACTINDDDAPGIVIDDITVTEGNAELKDAAFKVFLTTAYKETVTVNFATANGTALAGVDFVSSADTITFAPGETEKTIAVPIKGDTRHEVDKSFQVVLSNAVGAPLIDPQATGTIKDDDAIPSISITDVQAQEDDSGTTTMTFDVTLSAASGEPVKVSFATGGGTASANDYAATTGTLTFDPDTTKKTIAVQINGDTLDEPNETFNVVLSNVVGATIAKSTGIGTILDNDPPPILTIDDVALAEGNAGTPTMTFTLRLAQASGKQVSVTYATANDSALAGTDYIGANGTLTFAPGETQKTIAVSLSGDLVDEGPERFFVNLSAPMNATLERTQATGTILNDDGVLPNVTINDITVGEGNGGNVTATFTVSLSVGSSSPIDVTFATANGTATSGSDYGAASGTVSFAPFETAKTISITVNGDTLFEPTETFFVNLTGATNASIIDAQGIGTITNDDPEPTVAIAGVTQVEGNSGTSTFAFPVVLSGASAFPVSVTYQSADGTASSGSDYASASGVLTFAPGETSKEVVVNVSGDTTYELSEAFTVLLSTPINTTITTATATGTITADDAAPVFSIDDVTKQEGNTGVTAFTFTITKTGATSLDASVSWATADGTASSPLDFTAGSGVLGFLPNETSKTITVNVITDAVPEAAETFVVNLSSPVGATIGDAQGEGLVQNDDGPIRTLSINDRVVTEGNTGTKTVQFTVTLSPTIDQTVTVNFATANGTASAGTDYVAQNGTLTFDPNQTTRTITITVNGDALDEDDETFFVRLSSPSVNATILDAEGQGTITDDDPTPSLSVADITINETDVDRTATFTITLSAASGRTVSVAYATADGTARSTAPNRDFFAVTGAATFAPGETTQTVVVTIRGDNVNESNEEFFLNLSNPTNATISDAQAECRINDDD